MRLFPFLLINLAAFAMLHFAWIPSAERRFRVDRTMATISRSGLLSLLGFFRSVFLVATLTTTLVIVILFILGMGSGVTAGEVTTAIESIHRWRAFVVSIGPVWGWIVIALLVLALAIYSRRSGRRNMVNAFQKMYARKFEELRQAYELGNLKEMPPTAEMRDVAKRIGEINKTLAGLEGEAVRDDPKTIQMREHLNEQVSSLQKYYVALDMQRRIDLQLDPDEAALPEARTRWEKFQTFFISRGLLASLNGASRAIFLTSLILLVPSLISVYSVSAAATLNHRLVELKDLRVELSRREFEQEKARLGEPTNELSDDDKRDLQEVARNYEQSVPRPIIATGMRASIGSVRSTLVRETILSRAATQANAATEQYAAGAKWEHHTSGSSVPELTQLEREVVLAPEKSIKTHGPITPQGQRVYSQLEDIARRSPTFMERVRTGLHSFQKPATSYDISHSLFNQVAGTLANEGSPEFGNAFQSLTTGRRHPAFNGFTEMQSREFLSDLMGGSSVDEAMRRTAAPESRYAFLGKVEKLEFHSTMRTVADDLPLVSLNEKLAAYPPTVDVKPEAHVNMEKAGQAVERYRNRVPDSLMRASRGSADSLVDFTDWFPAQVDADTKTPRGKLLDKWSGGSGSGGLSTGTDLTRPGRPRGPTSGGGGISGRQVSRSTTGAVARAGRGGSSWGSFIRGRSFGRLRGFSRVGGVLIGQAVTEGPATKPNYIDIRWETQGSDVRFVLISADGQQNRSRPYRMNIAYQALNYAADGRPLAVTMVKADPLLELRILLHPTLVDTALGHRVIELDRFVDTYTGSTWERQEAENRVKAHDFLYKFAWAVRAKAYLDAPTEEVGFNEERRAYQAEVSDFIHNQENRAAARLALKESASIADPQLSPLTVKKEFYDQTLVQILATSAPETTLDSLSDTIRARLAQETKSAEESGDETKLEALGTRCLSQPPEFEIWSGVRERDFDGSVANFLVADGAAMPMPFDFMLQVAFTSQPAFTADADPESYSDSQPWEFPALREKIQTRVLQEIAGDQRAKTVLEDTSELAMLQRLFRMALTGELGENFPVEKMAELNEVLSVGAPQKLARTLRWNNPCGANLAAAALELKEAKSEEEGRLIERRVQREFNEPCLLGVAALLNYETADLRLLQEIRQELGVDKDDKQIQMDSTADLPALD